MKAAAVGGRRQILQLDIRTTHRDFAWRPCFLLQLSPRTAISSWLGGEIWRSMFTARGRMLEYTLELEAKIAQAKLGGDNTRLVMGFCGAGFHWRLDELEDFVSFYFSGRHRADDPFSQAELEYMAEKKLGFARTINSF